MSKVKEIATKIYKPEILLCPFCNSNLKYKYAVSNRVIQFSSGKIIRIKNLGYGCPSCNDGKTYFSQTANKLAFKGYTYSAKVVCMIYYYKSLHYSRDAICDILDKDGITISERNIDIIYNEFVNLFQTDPRDRIENAYKNMLNVYGEIRISLDVTGVNDTRYAILYDFFTSEKLAIWEFKEYTDEYFIDEISKYINKNLKITYIVTIRNIYPYKLIPFLKSIAPDNTKFLTYNKF